jgi:hypothetical protein
MRVDNTIFSDEDGNVLYQTQDDLDDAIVIVGNDQKSEFLAATDALQNSESVNQGDIANLRKFGDSYMVDGMEALWAIGQNTFIPTDHPDNKYEDSNGNRAANLNPELSAPLSRDGSTLRVDVTKLRNSNLPDMVSLGTGPFIHTHPSFPEGTKVSRQGNMVGIRDGAAGPSSHLDYPRNSSSNRGRADRHYDAVIDKSHIYLYRGYSNTKDRFGRRTAHPPQEIKVPRSFFK